MFLTANYKLQNKKGFTLIELLVVIAIIVILASLGVNAYATARGKARDALRRTQMKDLQTALETYNGDNGSYPLSATNGTVFSTGETYIPVPASPAAAFTPKYIPKLPIDPSGGVLETNGYSYKSDGKGYKIKNRGVETPPVKADTFYNSGDTSSLMVCMGETACSW